MKRGLFILFFLLIGKVYGQLDTAHYIAPLFASDHSWTAPGDQVVYLSTPEQSAVNYSIKDGAGNVLKQGVVSNDAPVFYTMNGYGTDFMLDENDLNKVLVDRGLHISADAKIYCNLRANSSGVNQATSLTCKGSAAKGKIFRIGHYPSPQSSGGSQVANKSSTFGIYATEDNTTVSIDLTEVQPLLHGPSAPSTSSVIELVLNAGETYCLAIKNQEHANNPGQGMIGSLVTSDKDIVVNCGSWGGNLAAQSSVDVGIDQIVPFTKAGTEYAIVRGASSNNTHENVMVVAHVDGTQVFINGSSSPAATLGAGEYHLISGSSYVNGAMYVKTSEPAFAFQFLLGSNSTNTQGMNYLPPISCSTSNFVDNIPFIEDIGSRTYGGAVSIVTTQGANIRVNGATPSESPIEVPGSVYEMYKISGLTGHVSVTSNTIALVGFVGVSGVAGYGGYFSGFEVEPPVPDMTCLPGYLIETTGRFTTYQWFKDGQAIVGANSDSLYAEETGSYTFEYTLGGCRDTSEVFNAVGVSDFSFDGQTSFCPGDSVQMTVVGTGFDSISWETGEIGPSVWIHDEGNTNVRIYSDITQECFVDTFVTTTGHGAPAVAVNDTTICPGGTATFNAYSATATQYSWSGLASGSGTVVTGSTAGVYTVVITDNEGCKDTTSAVLTIATKPTVSLDGMSICENDSALFVPTSSTSESFSWTFGGQAVGSNSTLTAYNAGTYTLVVEDENQCKDTVNADLVVNPIPIVQLDNLERCEGSAPVTFQAVSPLAVSYQWSEMGSGNDSITEGLVAGSYKVVVESAYGCLDSAIAVLTVHALPEVSVRDTAICAGDDAVEFNAISSTAQSYLWSDNANGTASSVQGSSAGNYTVEVTDSNSCKSSASGLLTVNSVPTATMDSRTICEGDDSALFEVQVVPSGNYDYQWGGLGTGSNTICTGIDQGNYSVVVEDENGCRDTATALLTVYPKPTVTVEDLSRCEDAPAVLFQAQSILAENYTWSGRGSGNQVSAEGLEAGNYTVVVESQYGCLDTATGTLTVNALPEVSVRDTAICFGDPAVEFTAISSNAESYLWSENGSGTASSTSGNTPGNYAVQVTDSNLCTNTAVAVLTVHSLPVVTVSDTAVCSSELPVEIMASCSTAQQFEWSGPAVAEGVSCLADQAGTYLVSVLDGNQCSDQDSLVVSVVETPAAHEIIGLEELCVGEQMELSVNIEAQEIIWNNDEQGEAILVDAGGEYHAKSSNYGHGVTCSTHSDTVIADFIEYPDQPQLDTFHFCSHLDGEIEINIPTNAFIYWEENRLASDSLYTINKPGVYTASLFHDIRCAIDVEVEVEEHCPMSCYVPNAFTPNSDGVNDFFLPITDNVSEFNMVIFNRAGEEIFSSESAFESWDGTFNNFPVQQDVYVYRIYIAGYNVDRLYRNRIITGTVTLIR